MSMNDGMWRVAQRVDIAKGVDVGTLVWKNALMLPGDKQAHVWDVSVFNDGVPVDLSSVSVTAYFVRVDGNPVVVKGKASGNRVSVVFAPECYAFPGTLRGVMKIASADSSVIATIAETYFTIGQNIGGSPVDPGSIFPSVDELIAKLAELDAGLAKLRNSEVALNTAYANALKRSVSGEIVVVDDVSPLTHTVECNIKNKNLFSGGSAVSFVQRETIDLLKALEPGTYTVSAMITSDDTDSNSSTMGFVGGNQDESIAYAVMGRDIRTHRTVTLYHPVTRIFLNASDTYSGGANDNATWTEVQIEEGSKATEYADNIPDLTQVRVTRRHPDGTDSVNFTPSADGSITGMTSLPPAMTILTDNPGALVSATYNQDPIRVINKLSDRVAALESASTQI